MQHFMSIDCMYCYTLCVCYLTEQSKIVEGTLSQVAANNLLGPVCCVCVPFVCLKWAPNQFSVKRMAVTGVSPVH